MTFVECVVSKNWIDFEFDNWVRWAHSGPMAGPPLPVDPRALYEDAPKPVNAERAQVVQRVFDSSAFVERKILQAEYLSPWKYARYSHGVAAAVRRLNAIDPDMNLSVKGYETILISMRRRVERAFA